MEQALLEPRKAPPAPRISATHAIPSSFGKKIADLPESVEGSYENCLTCCGNCGGRIRTYCVCCCCFDNPYVTIPQGNVGIVSKFGKAYKIIDPGMFFINQKTESVRLVDIKIQMADIPRQIVMTKDNVSLSIDSVLYWHIVDPFVAAYQVDNVHVALMERTMTTLRDTIGAHTLQNAIENREAIAAEIKRIIDSTSLSWGVVVESILIKDMSFSAELQNTLSAVAKQKRLGESKVITAKSEVQAAKLMREASDILCTPAAIQIRYLETLTAMARAGGTKIIFMPKDSHHSIDKATKNLTLNTITN